MAAEQKIRIRLKAYDHEVLDRSAREIVDTQATYISDIGLAKHLSPTRNNGLAALLGFIRDRACEQLETARG